MDTQKPEARPLGGAGHQRSPGSISRAVARAKEGDPDAFTFLYSCYAQDVNGYARSILRDQDDAEEVTQQVFTKLLKVIDSYQERGVPFAAWILRVTRNVALDHLRSRRTIPVDEVRAPDSRSATALACERAVMLNEALATLPCDQRNVVLLRHLTGLSPGEIGRKIGRSESAVHGLHHRGRRALAAELTRRGAAPAIARPSAAVVHL